MKKFTTNILKDILFQEEKIDLRTPDCYWEWSLLSYCLDFKQQEWLGLGGSITQASGENFNKLAPEKQQRFIEDYFGSKGLNYQFLRMPIASCNFSSSSYEYISMEDGSDFSILKDSGDFGPMLDYLKEKKHLQVIASPWSPPHVWKDNHSLYQGGQLLKEYYPAYARYLRQYIKEYQKQGVAISYITLQNEPYASQAWESCTWSLSSQKQFLYHYLIPEFQREHISTQILLWDHNKEKLFEHVKMLYQKNPVITGVALHSYSGHHFKQLDWVRQKYPELLLLETECCSAFEPYQKETWLSSAEYYLGEILGNMRHGLNAFLDWNLLLDFHGGPNHKNNFCKSPILLNESGTDYIKTPIYYYLKHLALIPIHSRGIEHSIYDETLSAIVCEGKEQDLYFVLLNRSNQVKEICILIDGQLLQDFLAPHSIVTYISKKEKPRQ